MQLEKQIEKIILDTLKRSTLIAQQQKATMKIGEHELIPLAILEEVHKSSAANLGMVIAGAIRDGANL